MKKRAVTVTEAARKFSNCISPAHYQNVPDREKVCYGRDLAKVLGKFELPIDEAQAWRRDMRAGLKILKAPVAKWR